MFLGLRNNSLLRSSSIIFSYNIIKDEKGMGYGDID
jgi:hypothetical protein